MVADMQHTCGLRVMLQECNTLENTTMAGRPPKPPALRIADGTHRADRHGPKDAYGAERYFDKTPKCPNGKQPTFRKWWNHYCKALANVGQLCERDLSAIEQLCDAHQEIFDAEATIRQDGGRYVATPMGIVPHPGLKTILLSRKLIQTAHAALGFGGHGRSKLPPRNLSVPGTTTTPGKPASGVGQLNRKGNKA